VVCLREKENGRTRVILWRQDATFLPAKHLTRVQGEKSRMYSCAIGEFILIVLWVLNECEWIPGVIFIKCCNLFVVISILVHDAICGARAALLPART
jgi:hypothetical protein